MIINYAVCEISGKQYKVIPGQTFDVSLQRPDEALEAPVLLLSQEGKLQIGAPYLKEKLTFKRLEDVKGAKIRVSKFHAKANFRKTRGYRSKITRVVFEPAKEKASVKKTA